MLEIGCGIGQLAYELADYLVDGTYTGFDVSESAISWLDEHYQPVLPNFSFDLVAVNNARYAPDGAIDPNVARFPYDDGVFDFAAAFSVFTHMELPEITHYLTELRRVLEPSARAVVTFFAFSPRDTDPILDAERPFVSIGRGRWTISPELPEKGIGFDEPRIIDAVTTAGFEVVTTHEGGWHHTGASRRAAPLGQDAFVLAPLG